jgi:L-lactate dehydrogenase complex protein LldG
MSSRDRILARLRAAQASPLPCPTLNPARVSAEHDLANLKAQLTAAHADVVDATGPGRWRQALVEVCQRYAVQQLILPVLAPFDQLTAWPNGPQLQWFNQEINQLKDALFKTIDAGLTVAEAGITDTGTLVLRSSVAQPRTLSLVPPIHVCFLDQRRLFPSLASALGQQAWQTAMPTNLLFISGPSKTADIQQTLAYGAHGPKVLVVILVDEELA